MNKTIKFSTAAIKQLPDNKPVLYRIETERDTLNYVGIAQKGRVRERIKEHIGIIPGANVKIEQFDSISKAHIKESNIIKRTKPKYNKQGT